MTHVTRTGWSGSGWTLLTTSKVTPIDVTTIAIMKRTTRFKDLCQAQFHHEIRIPSKMKRRTSYHLTGGK